jgi:hypothetical protein
MEKPSPRNPYDLSTAPKVKKVEHPQGPKSPDYSPYSLGSAKTLREVSSKKR